MIKQKKGICIDCPTGAGEALLIAKRCRNHYWQYRSSLKGEKGKKVAEKRVIAKKSANQIDREIEYARKRKNWLPLHQMCEAELKGCQGSANQVHHMAGRSGDLLLDSDKWLACCHRCHTWITEHSAEAITMGLSLRRNC